VEVNEEEGSGQLVTSIHWFLDVEMVVAGCQVGEVVDASGDGNAELALSLWQDSLVQA
jgi:hypothetical protein